MEGKDTKDSLCEIKANIFECIETLIKQTEELFNSYSKLVDLYFKTRHG